MTTPRPPIALVTCRDEEERLPATLAALRRALPGVRIVVADDHSTDGTAAVAREAGAEVVGGSGSRGKGGAATRAARALIATALEPEPPVFVLCDGDLGSTSAELAALVRVVAEDRADLAIASFRTRRGGGFGIALRFARWAIGDLCGLTLRAPISGQRALRGELLPLVVPFAPRFGMEIGMTVDAARAGYRVAEVELDLEHRPTGRTAAGFAHRARQLADFTLVYLSRR